MAIQLGAVVLPDSMVWADRYRSQLVAQRKVRTLGGNSVVYSAQLYGGKAITLEAGDDHGWLTGAQVDALRAMADVADGVYTLAFGAETYSVMFRHEEAPALDLVPFVPRTEQSSGDYFKGVIKLVTV